MTYIGNVHSKLEMAVVELAKADRIVKISGGLTINSYRRHTAKIQSSFNPGFIHFDTHAVRFLNNFFRKDVRQIVLQDHDFNVHSRFVRRPELANDLATRASLAVRVLADLNDHDSRVFYVASRFLIDVDVKGKF